MNEVKNYSVIFFHPPTLRIRDMKNDLWVIRFFQWVMLQALIWTIVKIEAPRLRSVADGPYTHCAITDGVEYLDATLGRRFPSPIPLHTQAGRAHDLWTHAADVLGEVYERTEEKATTCPPMWEGFSVSSLLWLIGVGLLAESKFGKVASWIVRGLKNKPGLYCSEFVAEVIADFSGQPLYVIVDMHRVAIALEVISESILHDRVANRNVLLASDGVQAIEAEGAWVAFQALGEFAEIGDREPVLIRVGYGPGEEPLFPPFLVGLSDLARSPQLRFGEHIEPLPGPE